MIVNRHSHRKFPGRYLSRHSAPSSSGLMAGEFAGLRNRTYGTMPTRINVAALRKFLQQRLPMMAAAETDLAGNQEMPAVPR